MSDPYPININIEIDRDRLRRYLRCSRLSLWTIGIVGYGCLLGPMLIAENITKHGATGYPAFLLWAKYTAISLIALVLLTLACYFLFSHWSIARMSETLQVTVEGSFLRIRQQTFTLSDRKLHFRAIVDYTTTQNWLMRRFGIYTLHLTTIGGGTRNFVNIPGVKDCLAIRDTLADIDRLRENN